MNVSNEARQAAARWAKINGRHHQAANIPRGSCDGAPIVQAFAKFEAEITQRDRDEALEAAAKVADSRCASDYSEECHIMADSISGNPADDRRQGTMGTRTRFGTWCRR